MRTHTRTHPLTVAVEDEEGAAAVRQLRGGERHVACGRRGGWGAGAVGRRVGWAGSGLWSGLAVSGWGMARPRCAKHTERRGRGRQAAAGGGRRRRRREPNLARRSWGRE